MSRINATYDEGSLGINLGKEFRKLRFVNPVREETREKEAEERDRIARRIVACVNACEGIEDPTAILMAISCLKGLATGLNAIGGYEGTLAKLNKVLLLCGEIP